MKRGVAAIAGGLVLVALAASPVAASPAPTDPVSDARAKVAAAQKAADEAAARYADAETRMGQLSDQIDRLQQQITKNEALIAPLRAAATRRAVTAYKDSGSGIEFFAIGDEPLDGARRLKLLDEAHAKDTSAVARLAQVQNDLDRQRDDIETRRAEHTGVLEQLQAEARRLGSELTEARKAAAGILGQRSGVSVGGLICPINGPMSFVDSWGDPRGGGRSHQGVDLMAPRGTPNVAVVSGSITMKSGGLAGNGVYLRGDDGNEYNYFHLDSYEGGPRQVTQGEVVGYVGNTGDASGGATHTHFEIHPGGGGAVNPYPAVRAVC
jgi:murein DD-endopeptidase MepM/ murein hydrolase activator NlpD